MNDRRSYSYRDAGVDIDAGDALVERIKPLVKRTQRPEVLAGIGGFGALGGIPAGYRGPGLVGGTGGGGTKIPPANAKHPPATGRNPPGAHSAHALSVD